MYMRATWDGQNPAKVFQFLVYVSYKIVAKSSEYIINDALL